MSTIIELLPWPTRISNELKIKQNPKKIKNKSLIRTQVFFDHTSRFIVTRREIKISADTGKLAICAENFTKILLLKNVHFNFVAGLKVVNCNEVQSSKKFLVISLIERNNNLSDKSKDFLECLSHLLNVTHNENLLIEFFLIFCLFDSHFTHFQIELR